MAKSKPRVRVPRKVEKGEVIEIKTLISHKMESGQRKDKKGNPIPRRIIDKFSCKLDGEEIFAMTLHPAISANPFIAFSLKAEKSGQLEFIWHDENGETYTAKKKLKVA